MKLPLAIVMALTMAPPATASGCHSRACKVRVAHKAAHRIKVRTVRPRMGWLNQVSWCESRNNPRAVGGGGRYRGMFQMTFSAWHAAGGRGDPVAYGRLEQRFRAVRFAGRIGWNNVHTTMGWPVCG